MADVSIDLTPFKKECDNKPVAILGLGASGLSVVDACARVGIPMRCWDDQAERRSAAQAHGAVIQDLMTQDMAACACLCMAPGIPLTHPATHPVAARAIDAGCLVLGDIELFHRALPQARTIGITGTNGKSTTTALIHHILQSAQQPCAMGGNIGMPALSLPVLPENGLYILELSSYQLDLCTDFAPDIAVWLNIAADHLDRHGSMEGYIAAKKRIFRGSGQAVMCIDDTYSQGVFEGLRIDDRRHCITVSTQQDQKADIYIDEDGRLFERGILIAPLSNIPTLKGRHNFQNMVCAFAACRAAGLDADVIVQAIQSFPGLIHRQFLVRKIDQVSYINDSKATNDDAASVALAAYENIYWIAGGQSKGSGYTQCQKYIDHVHHAFLIGEAQDELASWLKTTQTPYTLSGTLDRAVQAAHSMAHTQKQQESHVLLAPACASWDQFDSFGARGDHFVRLVEELDSVS